jgi:tRNA A-37 threonylcarbamoyl transferase component Bud32/predicted Zn-dependent protease
LARWFAFGSNVVIGKTISHFHVLRKIGGGGMGVVYEAEDLRLKRRVALKFLPEALAHDSTALQRFEREACAASSLNHPNICTIYEIAEHESQPVIVMELLEGVTLKERLARGALPLNTVLDLAIEICAGLEAAHSRGIIHRDIKPANIFITSRGTAKILDFGLAKLIRDHEGGTETVKVVGGVDEFEEPLTAAGVVHGTAFYMSPEQAEGAELDRRTDLFSLGVVLYEMVAGRRPFSGRSRVTTLEAIVGSKPSEVRSSNPAIPSELDHIIQKALEKNPEFRYQTAAEMASDLKRLKRERESATIAAAAPVTIATPVRKTWKIAIPIAAVAVAVALGLFFYSRGATALTEKDTIVLADFINKTGDPVFDETLKQALAVDLGQSPFLNILSDRKIAATMRLMGRAPDQPLTGELARELCQRVGSKAMLAGSISSLGNEYVIGLNAINCASGDTLLAEQARASGKGEVLRAVDNSASALRKKLGESLASVQKFSAPIEEATTSSLEALKAYSMARKVLFSQGDAPANPYYQQALELDPNFAMAYSGLAVNYANLGQATRSAENAKKAFDLRERVSEREKYRISALYYSFTTGEVDKANQFYELWKQSYPRDALPPGNLADNYMRLGQWEKALLEVENSFRLEPSNNITNSNLAWIQLALNRMDEARTTVEQALARKLESYFLRLNKYEMAFLRGDKESMQQQLASAAGRPGEEDWLLSTQSDTEAYFGRLTKAREFSQRAVESARRADAKETAALWLANAALREAEFGNVSSARQQAMQAMALVPGRDVTCLAALALARVGDTEQAQKLAESLNKEFPLYTVVQGYWLPSIRSAIELNAKNAAGAVEILQAAAPYELAQSQPFQVGMMYPVYLRGQAYLLARKGKEAAAEFQKIIDHRGVVLNFPLGALAHLGLARAYALQGDAEKSRAEYDTFLNLWKDADADVPILQQAKDESAKVR